MKDRDFLRDGLGLNWADLPADKLPDGTRVVLTFNWAEVNRWEGRDFFVVINENQPGFELKSRG
jgi:hypothetical protein